MTDHSDDGLPNVDNLTPFEYALAGVAVPDALDSPSLAVIERMRRLAMEVQDAKISQPRLRELMAGGGANAEGGDRRLIRRRRSNTTAAGTTGAGSFIDITPVELTEGWSNGTPSEDIPVSGESPVAAAVTGEIPPAAVTAEILPAGGPDMDRPDETEAEPSPPVDPYVPMPAGAVSGRSVDAEAARAGTLDEEQPSTGARDGRGRFTDGPPVTSLPVLLDDQPPEPDTEGAVLVPAAADQVSTILGRTTPIDDDEHRSAAPIPAFIAALPVSRRSRGTSFWALTGTAAAAAALALGGLWWASGLGNRTEAQSAAPQLSAETRAGGTTTESGRATLGSSGQARNDGGRSSTGAFGDRLGSSTIDPTSAPSIGRGTGEAGPQPSAADTARTTVPRSSATTGPSVAPQKPIAGAAGQTTTPAETTTSSRVSTNSSPTSAQTIATQPPTTARPATTTQPTVPPLAVIGDSVNLGSSGGAGVPGVRVDLYVDENRDGQPGDLRQSATTTADGRYGFRVSGGCYVVRFVAPDGYELQSDQVTQPICLNPGETVNRIDAVINRTPPRPPSGCKVEPKGDEYWRGVEVFENGEQWAESYIFYDKKESVVVRTADLGPPDDVESPTNHEWHAQANGFDHRLVRSVAAIRGGSESKPVTCDRE